MKLYSLVGALLIGGAIASCEGYVLAQTPCQPGQVCVRPPWTPRPHRPEPGAFSGPLIEELQKLYPQAIQQLQQKDPQAIEKLRRLDPETVQQLEQLAPNSREQVQRYAPQVIQQQPNQPAIKNQLR